MTSRKRQHSTETNQSDTNLLLHDTTNDNDNDNDIDEKKQAAAPRWWQQIIRRQRQSPPPTTTATWWWSHPTSRRQQLPLRSVRNDHCKQHQQQRQDEKGSLGVVIRLVVVPGTVVVIVLLILHQAMANLFAHPLSTMTHMLPALDFVVAGFPKCGTTTLLYAFRQQQQQSDAANDILMSSREVCAVKDKRRREAIVQERYRRELKHAWNVDMDDKNNNNNNNKDNKNNEHSRHGNLQKGIKCPTIVYSDKAIERLLTWHNHTSSFVQQQQQQQNAQEQHISSMTRQDDTPLRWIIGMRHPIHQVQSYYNYLVTEVYDKGYWWYKGIPSLESILLSNGGAGGGGVPWKDMTADTHRYEIHLERLLSRLLVLYKQQQREQQQQREHDGDDDVAAEDMMHHHPNPWVFLYTLEQMQDGEAVEPLQRDLSTFVGSPHDLVLGHENVNRFTGAAAHPETIHLCQEQFAPLRAKLLRDSQQTADWMQDFVLSVKSPYLDLLSFGGGLSALRMYVQTWKRDICD